MSENILFLGKKSFEIPPFFQTRPGDLGKKFHACTLRFSALNARGVMTPFSRRARYAKTTGDESDPDLSSASECNLPSAHDQSEALPRSGYWHLGMKFLQSFLRRHFTAKPVLVLFSQAI